MWDLVPCPGTEPRPPASGTWSLSHWATREVPGNSGVGCLYHLIQMEMAVEVPEIMALAGHCRSDCIPLTFRPHLHRYHGPLSVPALDEPQAQMGVLCGPFPHHSSSCSSRLWSCPHLVPPAGRRSSFSQLVFHKPHLFVPRGPCTSWGHRFLLSISRWPIDIGFKEWTNFFQF